MAKPGNFAAYQQSSPIREDFGNNMLQAEDQAFRYRAEKQAKEQEEYLRKREQDKDFQARVDKIKFNPTGFEPIDKHIIPMYSTIMKEMGELDRAGRNGTMTDEQKYKFNMLSKTPEIWDASTIKFTEYADYLSKGVADGTLSKAAFKQAEIVKAVFDNKIVKPIDISTGLPIMTVRTESGEEREINLGSVANGSDFNIMDLPKKEDVNAWVTNRIKGLGTRQQIERGGGMVWVQQSFEDHKDAVNKMLDKQMGTLENPSDLAISTWYDHLDNDGDFTPAAYEQVKGYLTNEIRKGYNESIDSLRDVPTPGGSGSGDDDKNEPQIIDAQLVTDISGKASQGSSDKGLYGPSQNSSRINSNVKEYTLNTKGGEPIKGVIASNPETEILSIIQTKGGLYANVRTTSEVTETEKGAESYDSYNEATGSTRTKLKDTKTNRVKLSDTEANILARRFGLDNAAELTQYLNQVSGGAQQESDNSSGGNKYGI